jgi:hypothetical protein
LGLVLQAGYDVHGVTSKKEKQREKALKPIGHPDRIPDRTQTGYLQSAKIVCAGPAAGADAFPSVFTVFSCEYYRLSAVLIRRIT